MPLLTVSSKRNADGVFTIFPTGSIDSETYDILDKHMEGVFGSDPKAIVFDMKDLKYISSMGIRSILDAKNKIDSVGGALIMINLQPQIKMVFDIVRAIPSQNIFTSRKELDDYLLAMQKREIEKKDNP